MSAKRVVLLIGSPKGHGSSSESLGACLLDRLYEKGWTSERVRLRPSVKTDEGRARMLEAVDAADLLVFSFPLYVDSLPAAVIRGMELIAERRRAVPKKQRMLAIVQCGFPEAHQNDTALAICRRFASEAGLEWAGGLSLGMGGAIGGKPLGERGGMARRMVRALHLTADALADGQPAPEEARALMARRMMPTWLYLWIGNRMWKSMARKRGVKDLYARPFA